MALILNCNINYILHLKKTHLLKLYQPKIPVISTQSGSLRTSYMKQFKNRWHCFFGRKSFPPIRCSVSRRVHFQTFPSIDLTTNGWSFYSYTTDLVNNAEECERRPGKSACWGKILFYDVCKWQSSFSLQSKIVFWLTLIRARTDCTVR